jgi:hypothetical protein
MFRFCLVGFGRWGKVYFDTINRLDFCELDCIVLSGKNRSMDQATKIPIFNHILDVIGSRQVDGFIIATPPETHFNLAKICISNKFPVLVEKPYTTNHAQANQLTKLAIENNTMCMVGYQHLFASNYTVLKNLIDFSSRQLEVYSEGLSNGPFRNNVSVFRDWGSHEFSMAIDLFDEIPSSYTVRQIGENKEGDNKGVYLMELLFSLDRKYTSIFGNISQVKRRTLIASYPGGWGYLNGLDQGGCVVMKDGSILEPDSILSTGTMPLDTMLSQFILKSKSKIINFKSLNIAVEIVSLIDKIEAELIKGNKNV